jgi:hypothetical protein
MSRRVNNRKGNRTKASIVKSLMQAAKKAISNYQKHQTELKADKAHNAVNAFAGMKLSKADSKKLEKLETSLTLADASKKAGDYLKKSTLSDIIRNAKTRDKDESFNFATKRKAVAYYKRHYSKLIEIEFGKGWKGDIRLNDGTADTGKSLGSLFDELMAMVSKHTQLGKDKLESWGNNSSANRHLFKLRFFEGQDSPAKLRFQELTRMLGIDTDDARYPDSPTRT